MRFFLQATVKATLGGSDLRDAVRLPAGEDPNEWLAVNSEQHTVPFEFNL